MTPETAEPMPSPSRVVAEEDSAGLASYRRHLVHRRGHTGTKKED